MITDKNGNFFLNLGNNIPVRTFGPKELFGSNIEIHVDGSSTRDIFSDTGGTTNVNSSGFSLVNRLSDISGKNRHFYNYNAANTNTSLAKVTTTPGSFSAYFSGNTVDTNKGRIVYSSSTYVLQCPTSVGGVQSGGTGVFSGTSAFTVCSYSNVNTLVSAFAVRFGINYQNYEVPATGIPLVGLGKAGTVQGFGNNCFQVFLKNVAYTILTDMSQYYNTYHLYTLTVTGTTYSAYIDNNLVGSGTVLSASTFYPLNGTNTAFRYNQFYFNASSAVNTILGNTFPTLESFITFECATPEKVALLYEYFKRKYKN
jgi:hypothetical protein